VERATRDFHRSKLVGIGFLVPGLPWISDYDYDNDNDNDHCSAFDSDSACYDHDSSV
jgi:hypothetical protein